MSSDASANRLSIRVEIEQSPAEDPRKKRVTVYLDPEFAEALAKTARLSGIPQGEILEQATRSAWSAPLGSGKFKLRQP
jgi:hypothetical protein